MKRSLLLLLIICLNGGAFAQQKKSPSMEILAVNAKMQVFYTNGHREDIGQHMKIAFFKEYVLFEQQVQHLKSQHSVINLNNVKDGGTLIDDTEPDMTVEKVTYIYYIYKKGQARGLFYNEARGKTKSFSVDTLLMHSNLGNENEESVSRPIGKPTEIKKQGKVLTEKYYNFKDIKGLDTVIRVYDDGLKGLPFSISKKLDQEKNSKLTKSLQIIKIPASLEIQKNAPLKIEQLTEMEVVTKKTTKGQLQKFMRYFEKYEQDLLKNPIKVQ